ncbi:MAG: diaminopimelate decarboxylase [Planctomycetota bacterium]|nr:diaminopimelate decarboxylase [Planctomycetota bacterium]
MWWLEEGHLEVTSNQLNIGGMDAVELAAKYGTPLYVYNGNKVQANLNRLISALRAHTDDYRIHYAVKANSHLQIQKLAYDLGAYADCVSPVECEMALKAGLPAGKVLFTGTSVSNQDLRKLVDLGVRINIDSGSQLRRLAKLSTQPELSVRWNPGEGAGAGLHSHTITAGNYIKFGIPEHKVLDTFREAEELGFKVVGLHQHIGSGWLGDDVHVFHDSVQRTLNVANQAREILGTSFEFIDFGGGPGIRYSEDQTPFPIEEYAKGLVKTVRAEGYNGTIAIEPGRFPVGESGVLLLEVNTVEEKNIPIVGVDGGFNTLVRPAFYESYHEMVLANRVESDSTQKAMVAGNLCESSDVFNCSKKELREITIPEEGEVLALLCAGAYGFEMASTYNGRPLPAQVLVMDGKDHLITERGTIDSIVGPQKIVV